MDIDTVRSTGLATDATNPSQKGNDILLALESGELTFVEAVRSAVDRLKTDAASLADVRYLSDRSVRADAATAPDKPSFDRPRDRDETQVDDSARTADRPESRAEAPERDASASRRDDRRADDESRANSNRDDARPDRAPAAEPRADDSAKAAPSKDQSQSTGSTSSTETPTADAGAPAPGAEAAAAVHAAPSAQAATTSIARSMSQWSEMVLTELLGIVQNSAAQATATPTDTGEAVDPIGSEHASQGLANALAAVTRPIANRKGGGESNHRNTEQAPQANAFALGQELADSDVDAATTGLGRIAAQQAALARLVGPDDHLAVQVEIADEASILMSRPTSSLSAPGALAGDTNASSSASEGRGPNGSPIGANPAIVAQMNASSTAASTPTAGQTAGSSAAATIDAKAAVQAPAANHALGSNQASGGEAQAPSQANTANQTAAAHAAAQAKSSAQANKPAPFSQAVIDQVSVHITRAAASGTDRIDIQLRPESLGRIDVRLDMGADGRVSAIITADNRDTLDLLQRDARNLERSLQDAGLNADLGSLSFNLREQNADGSQGGSGEPAADPDAAVDEPVVDDRPTPIDVGLGLGAGRVDIRV